MNQIPAELVEQAEKGLCSVESLGRFPQRERMETIGPIRYRICIRHE